MTITSDCKIVVREKTHTLSITRETTPDAFGTVFAECFPAIHQFITAQGKEQSGRPFGRYLEMSDTKAVVECGIPVANEMAGEGQIVPSEIPAGRYVLKSHIGSFETLGETHGAINAFIAKQNLQIAGPPVEFYVSDPGEEPDPNKWQTDIIYPIA